MTDPLVPNYNSEVGRLATDRFDFQKHIDGVNFKHAAGAIDLFPTVVIGVDSATTVQDAINKIATAINTPIPDATVSQKGVIQLTGDLGGTAAVPRVIGLRGYPINTNAPNTNDILTWNGTSWGPVAPTVFTAGGDLSGSNSSQTVIGLQNRPVSNGLPTVGQVLTWTMVGQWAPRTIPTQFTAGGDLSGTSTSQQVINISGNGTYVNMTASQLIVRDGTTPVFTQVNAGSTDGFNFTINAQSTLGSNRNGGNVLITGGTRTSGGSTNTDGGVALRIGTTTPSYMVHCVSPFRSLSEPNKRVLGLVSNAAVTSTQMGTGTGDLVTYIGNAATLPLVNGFFGNPNTVGNPVNGVILYATSGKLHVRQSDGYDVTVGQESNPSFWGSVVQGSSFSTDGQVYTRRLITTTIGTGQALITSFQVPDHCAAYFDIKIVGKKDTPSTDMAWFHMSAGYLREGSSLTQATVRDNNTDGYLPFGAANPHIEHARYTTSAFSWTHKPTISTTGTFVQFFTGNNTGNTITWFTTITINICPSYSA